MLELNIKARQDVAELQTESDSKPCVNKYYSIHKLELNFYSSHIFCSILIEQLMNLKNLRT